MEELVRLLETRLGRLVRGSVLITFSIFCIVLTALWAQEPEHDTRGKQVDPVILERRLTTLEVGMSDLLAQVNRVEEKQWVIVLALAGLLGETGIRVVKRK